MLVPQWHLQAHLARLMVCDGLENECDGIIDDLDVGNDGICDCIMIATLGVSGISGQGYVFG